MVLSFLYVEDASGKMVQKVYAEPKVKVTEKLLRKALEDHEDK